MMTLVQSDLLLRGPLLLAGAALVPVGVSMHVAGHAPEWTAGLALGAAALAFVWSGAIALVRRSVRIQLVAGLGISAAVFAAAGIALARGRADARTQRERTAKVEALANAGVQEFPGWVGRVAEGGVVLFATQLDPQSPLGQMIVRTFSRPVVPVFIGVDNRAGTTPMTLDLSRVMLELEDGSKRPLPPRAEVLATAQGPERESVLAQHGGIYQIPAGGRLGNAIVFADPSAPLAHTVALRIRIDGRAARIPGRFLSAAEKNALRRQ
jgi:hypothetical protein